MSNSNHEAAHNLYKSAFLLKKHVSEVVKSEVKLTFPQFKIMMIVGKMKGCSQRHIAEHWSHTEAAVSRHVEQLVRLGLMTRTENKESRRQNNLVLTSKGFTQMGSAKKLVDSYFKKTFKVFTPDEQKQFAYLTDKLHKQLHDEQ